MGLIKVSYFLSMKTFLFKNTVLEIFQHFNIVHNYIGFWEASGCALVFMESFLFFSCCGKFILISRLVKQPFIVFICQ